MNLDVIAYSPEAARDACVEAFRVTKAITMEGKPVHITAAEYEHDRLLEQNAYYWAGFLPAISEQARIGGQRYTVDAWHELGKRQFLGFEVKKVFVAGKKRPVIIRRLRSTTTLKIKGFAKYLQEFEAFASTELGVVFPEKPPQ